MPEPGAGSGPGEPRTVTVPLHRLPRWIDGFAQRHGSAPGTHAGWVLQAPDGARAELVPPPWLAHVAPEASPADLPGLAPTWGVLLLRRAGYAVARLEGGTIDQRKVGSRHVHGRTAAGGWSQQRYARRRANQADEIVSACAAAAERVLPRAGHEPSFLVTGGDRPLLAALRPLLPPALAALPVVAHLAVGTPDAHVLAEVPDRVLAVAITLHEPD